MSAIDTTSSSSKFFTVGLLYVLNLINTTIRSNGDLFPLNMMSTTVPIDLFTNPVSIYRLVINITQYPFISNN